MAFNATSVTLENGLRTIREIASQEKNYLGIWATALNGDISAQYALDMLTNLRRVVPMMDQLASLPGMSTYAQQQLGSPTYDIVAEYGAMKTALQAVGTWLQANIPANALPIVNGVPAPQAFSPVATAPLRALVVAAGATIS